LFQKTPKKTCVDCGQRIVGVIPDWRDGEPLCRDCSFKYEPEDKIPAPETRKPGKKQVPEEQKDNTRKLWGIVLVVSILVFGATLPRLLSSLEDNKPVRIGDARTDKLGDQCITNLWRISKDLQDTASLNITLTCPASGKDYIILKTKDDVIILCPTPKLHKVRRIRVSRKRPFPEVVQ